ncbi:hypothetical protein GQ53DRAFT_649750 [Thozetella sp. PMI_491]|nr:hypothetical protein GQ53DRAFT_649750 [Thozetella sp. PMI_491]
MLALLTWGTRRAGGIAMLATLALSYWVISKEAEAQRHGYKYQQQDNLSAPNHLAEGAGIWVPIFAYYCLFIHLMVFMFPLRSLWSVWDITSRLKKTAMNKSLKDFKLAHRRRGSSTSLSSSETLTSSKELPSSSSSEAGDADYDIEAAAECDIATDRVIHGIIIPNYKEEMDTLRETLEVLASHPQARSTYDVSLCHPCHLAQGTTSQINWENSWLTTIYLAMEQRESGADLKALELINDYAKKFRYMDFTIHPSDIPGEVAGKGSNVNWAARKLSERYPLASRTDVIITGIDADSHLSSNYFALVTSMHIAHPETATTTLYSAPIIFDRNADKVPAIVRVADILWAAAGMSGLYSGSTIAPPTSVYSVPLELVDRVGGWDCDSEAIGEDLHMYLKCFFALNGNLTTRTVLSPVSSTNVHGGGRGKGIAGLYADVNARYKQALRHMWGCLDSGYAVRKFFELWRDRKQTTRVFRPLHSALNDVSDIYVPEIPLDGVDPEATKENGIFSDVTQDTLRDPDYERIFYMFHRLFEAHFLPLQTTILVFASTIFVWVTDGSADIHSTSWVFIVCNVLRTLGFLEVAVYLFFYEHFHRICLETREKEMSDAGLSKGMHFSRRDPKKNCLDYIMVPLVAPLYGAIPCAQAQVCHFWTMDLVYTVSKKVTRQRAKSLSEALLA